MIISNERMGGVFQV